MKVHKTIIFLYLGLLALFQVACGGDEGSSVVKSLAEPTPGYEVFWGSCDNGTQTTDEVVVIENTKDKISNPKTCREWYGDFFATINIKQACSSIERGIHSVEYCSEEDQIGVCVIPISIDSETRIFYYSGDLSLKLAKKHCRAEGANAQWLEL